jgi:hypothetical protein
MKQPIIGKAGKTNDRRWSRVASTRDLPTIAFFRAGVLLRRSVPVPGILATLRPGALWISLGASSLSFRIEVTSQLLTKRKQKTDPHTRKPTHPAYGLSVRTMHEKVC